MGDDVVEPAEVDFGGGREIGDMKLEVCDRAFGSETSRVVDMRGHGIDAAKPPAVSKMR